MYGMKPGIFLHGSGTVEAIKTIRRKVVCQPIGLGHNALFIFVDFGEICFQRQPLSVYSLDQLPAALRAARCALLNGSDKLRRQH